MNKNVTGIYKIENLKNKKFYVGASKNIKQRWKHHKTTLRLGTHHNKYLQKEWIIYGQDNFKFYILEECDINCIWDKETYYLSTQECHYNYKFEYVITPKGKLPIHIVEEERAKGLRKERSNCLHFVVVTPENKYIDVFNLQRFCNKHNLNRSSMYLVARGYKKSCKGYQCFFKGEEHKALDASDIIIRKNNSGIAKAAELISPKGEIHIVKNLSQFAKDNNLCRSKLSAVCRGERNHHRKWKGKYITL